MLQISAGKFFQSSKLHETLYRCVYYTNYRVFDDAKIETPVGVLLPSTAGSNPSTLTYEVVERIEAHPNSPVAGEIISTGGGMVVNDFAAIISFALNLTCTPDPDLARRPDRFERPISRQFTSAAKNYPAYVRYVGAVREGQQREAVGVPQGSYRTRPKAL